MDRGVGMTRTMNETTCLREKKGRKKRNEVAAFAVDQVLLSGERKV